MGGNQYERSPLQSRWHTRADHRGIVGNRSCTGDRGPFAGRKGSARRPTDRPPSPASGAVGRLGAELDVSDPEAIEAVVGGIGTSFGGLDAVVFTSAVVPFARVEDTDATTWLHAYAVNAVGASHVLRAALPHLAENAVALFASSHDVGRPRAGVAAYHASKAALDEILRSWRAEHPDLPIIRVSIGPTADTEILRGADLDLLADLYREWAREGRIPARMSAVEDVANALLSFIAVARANPSVVSDIVHLSPRTHRRQ